MEEKKKGEEGKKLNVDRSKIHEQNDSLENGMGCKIFIGSNDGQSIQIYFFDLFVRRNENSIINVVYTLYISRFDVKDSFLENLDDQPGPVYF